MTAPDTPVEAAGIPGGACPVSLGPHRLLLLPGGGVAWPGAGILLLADLHLGKAELFRRRGLPLPDGDDAADLLRLRWWTRRLGVRHLVVLGDLVHGEESWTPGLVSALGEALPPERTLVPGNHDRALPPASLGFRILPEGSRLEVPDQADPPLHLRHTPDLSGSAPLHMAGHLHPVVRLDAGGERLRTPCFVRRGPALVLPAWGGLTGGHPWGAAPGDQVWADLRAPRGHGGEPGPEHPPRGQVVSVPLSALRPPVRQGTPPGLP
jgi:DNA ligase-associated metallophosphoesterase